MIYEGLELNEPLGEGISKALNTDFWHEGSFSPRDGLGRTIHSGTFGYGFGPVWSLLPFRRFDQRTFVVGKQSGTLAYARNVDPAYDEEDF